MKLWNDEANQLTTDNEGATAIFTNVEVDIWNQKAQLGSLEMTNIEIVTDSKKEPKEGSYTIIGIDSNKDALTLITDTGTEYQISHNMLTDAGYTEDELVNQAPITARINTTDKSVTSIAFKA